MSHTRCVMGLRALFVECWLNANPVLVPGLQVISDTNVVAGELVLGAVGKQPVSGSRHVVSKLLNSQAMESGAVAVAFLGTQVRTCSA